MGCPQHQGDVMPTKVRRVLLTSPKGGAGKTVISRNLAVAAALAGKKVATADLDPQMTLTRWARRRPDGLPEITHFRVEWEQADALLDDEELKGFDVLIIDTPPSIETQPAAFNRLLEAADFILVPTRPTFDDAESAAPYLTLLRERGRPCAAVINATKPRVATGSVKEFLIEAAELCPVEVSDRADYARAGQKGLGLADVPGHAGGEEMKAVWAYVAGRLWGRRRAAA